MKTLSACLSGIKQIEVRQRNIEIAEDEVLVKTSFMGICGSDKTVYNGDVPPQGGLNTEMRTPFNYPFYFGHEACGVVEEVGSKVRKLSPGDKVVAFAWVETFSTYFKSREDDLERYPEELDPEVAGVGEPASCAVFSGMNANIQLGDTVAVVGMGFAGQIISQVAKAKGAYKTIGVDLHDKKLVLAEDLGLDYAVNANKVDARKAILDITNKKGVDVVIEAGGSAETINLCSDVVRHNGTIAFYSWVINDVTLNISRWHNNSLTILNTGMNHHGVKMRSIWCAEAFRVLAQNQINVKSLITHTFPLKKIDKAFEADPSAVKVLLYP